MYSADGTVNTVIYSTLWSSQYRIVQTCIIFIEMVFYLNTVV